MSIANGATSGLLVGAIIWIGAMVFGLLLDSVFDKGGPVITPRVTLRMLAVFVGGGTAIGTLLSLLLRALGCP